MKKLKDELKKLNDEKVLNDELYNILIYSYLPMLKKPSSIFDTTTDDLLINIKTSVTAGIFNIIKKNKLKGKYALDGVIHWLVESNDTYEELKEDDESFLYRQQQVLCRCASAQCSYVLFNNQFVTNLQ